MRRFGFAAILALALPFTAQAQVTEGDVTVDAMRSMSQDQLDKTYVGGKVGTMPRGDSNGTAVFFPGSILNTPTQMLAAMVWQGKVFDTDNGVLLNKVFGFHAIKAKLYFGKSLFDGKESIIIDYSKTSILAHKIRDEIRLVAPNLYLGRAYMRTMLGDYMIVNFILDFN